MSITRILNDEASTEKEKQKCLLSLLKECCAKRALHEYLWEDIYEGSDMVANIIRIKPFYKTLEECSILITPKHVARSDSMELISSGGS